MNNETDIKKLWQSQQPETPDTKEFLKRINSFRRRNIEKLVATNIMLLTTGVFIGYIWYAYQPEMLTTKLGIILAILAMILYLVVYNQMLPLLFNADYKKDSAQYLQHILKLKKKQSFLQSTMLTLYFVMLSAGMYLYFVEFVMRMSWTGALLTYGLSFSWILFAWFYIRPKKAKKQKKHIDEIIEKLGKIQSQFGEK